MEFMIGKQNKKFIYISYRISSPKLWKELRLFSFRIGSDFYETFHHLIWKFKNWCYSQSLNDARYNKFKRSSIKVLISLMKMKKTKSLNSGIINIYDPVYCSRWNFQKKKKMLVTYASSFVIHFFSYPRNSLCVCTFFCHQALYRRHN